MIHHPNLDPATRALMEQELDVDLANDNPPVSRRLTQIGADVLPSLIRAAVRFHDDNWLAREVACCGRLHTHETSHRKGRPIVSCVPYNAPEMIAEGQIRRYYLRALALRATGECKRLVVVRGKHVDNPRPESQQLIGKTIDPADLYNFAITELEDAAYKGPFSHNSGLTVQLE